MSTTPLNLFLHCLTALALCFGASTPLAAQLDLIHYIPPCHAAQDRGQQYLYLTTPEKQPFDILITTGTGTEVLDGNGQPIGPITISNSSPRVIYLGDGGNPPDLLPTLTRAQELNVALDDKGFILSASRAFYANLRVRSTNQAGSLTAKGRAALGTSFRIGHIHNEVINGFSTFRRANFVGIMATEDNTEVTFSQYRPGISLYTGGTDLLPAGPIQVTLMAGQCYVLSTYVDGTRPYVNTNGLQGMLVESSAPIAVNCGSWLGSPWTQSSQDMGIDQIIPVERVGAEYITIRGDGPDGLETPIVVATEDGTQVFLNGNPIPAADLDAGGVFRVPQGSYSPGQNLYILATHPVYVYQMLGGADLPQTGGLNFVPPLGCSEGGFVNHIMDINRIGNVVFEGKLLVLAQTGKTVWINGNAVPAAQFQPVPGKPEFRTLKIPNLTGDVRVDSDGPLQVGMFGRNNNAGWAGYFSGFDILNRPSISVSLASSCGDTLLLNNLVNVDSIIWFRNGLTVPLQNDTLLTGLQPGVYFAVALREFCDEILWDTSELIIVPEPFTMDPIIHSVTCPDYPGGGFELTGLQGGFAPYEVSYDDGQSFSTQFRRDSLPPGTYPVMIRDSAGCLFSREIIIPYEPDIPVVQIAASDTLTCQRTEIILDASGSSEEPRFQIRWIAPPGALLSEPNALVSGTNLGGTYVLEITNSLNGCVRQDSVTVARDTLAPPLQLLPTAPLTCRDSTVIIRTLSATPRPLQRDWSLDGQPYPADPSADSLAVSLPGIYMVSITDLQNGCTSAAMVEIVEDRVPPMLQPGPPALLTCRDTLVPLSATLGDPVTVQWQWSGPPGGIQGPAVQPQVQVNRPGTYAVVVVATGNGCVATTDVQVGLDTVAPLVDAGSAEPLTCRDTVIQLQGSSFGCSGCLVTWSHAGNGILQGASTLRPMIRDTGHYRLTLEDPGNGCRSVDSVLVNRIPPPEAFALQITPPDCERYRGAITFGPVSGGTPPYRYSFDGGQSSGTSLTLDPAPGGAYTLVVTDAFDCRITQSLTLDEIIPLALTLTPRITLEWGSSLTLDLQVNIPPSAIAAILWTPEEHLSCSACAQPVTTPPEPMDYTVTITDIHGCSATASIRVDLALDRQVYIPNAFHPDGNGINDGFTAFADPTKVSRITWLRVYDRWGNHLFETRDIPVNRTDQGWDGTYRGKPMDPGVFVYVLEVEYADRVRQSFKGDVHLVR